ncbi:MAG: redoxin domain-containing protein [Pirellulaceae bacterium]|nr:redoxin domain-containing protein [Pirellulaceae bacterium]
MRIASSLVFGIVVLTSLSGCQPQPMTPSSTTTDGGGASTETLAPTAEIKIVHGDEKKLAELVAAQKGKVVFVDYWATWCEPCVEYFPHTVEMANTHGPHGLATIAVSFDEPDNEPLVRKFIADQKAESLTHLISTYPQGPEAFEGFNLVTVPTFRLYDRKGVKRYEWEAKPTDADEKIAELLAEAP